MHSQVSTHTMQALLRRTTSCSTLANATSRSLHRSTVRLVGISACALHPGASSSASPLISSQYRCRYFSAAPSHAKQAPVPAADNTAAAASSALHLPPLSPSTQFYLAYLAHPGCLSLMLDEIDLRKNEERCDVSVRVMGIYGNLVVVRIDTSRMRKGEQNSSSSAASPSIASFSSLPSSFQHPLHCATIWLSPQLASYTSISSAVRCLRDVTKRENERERKEAELNTTSASTSAASSPAPPRKLRWHAYTSPDNESLFRRQELIREELPNIPKWLQERIVFPLEIPITPVAKLKASSSNPSAAPTSTATSTPTPPLHPPAVFTLLSRNELLYSASTSSPLPNGRVSFEWDRVNPPSQAYAKLWEVLTRMHIDAISAGGEGEQAWLRVRPQPGQVVLDLGSSPGGWSYVLAQLGATVLSVDRADLHPSVAKLVNVNHRQQSAFALEPHDDWIREWTERRREWSKEKETAAISTSTASSSSSTLATSTPSSPLRIDWLFCDIISYPERTLSLIRRWLGADVVEHGMVVTIKLQQDGERDDDGQQQQQPHRRGPAQEYHLRSQSGIIDELRQIPNSKLIHLSTNKNEVTFVWRRP